jgi:CheY-like chemotaxis protein
MSVQDTSGCRILVVEDETLIAFEIEAVIEALECTVVGPVSSLEAALRMAGEAAFDAAILDLTIRGGKSLPVAERLHAQGIPFVLASGYADWTLPDWLRDRPRLTKPFTQAELEERIRGLCGDVARRKGTVL